MSISIIRRLRMQGINYKHLYFLAMVWLMLLYNHPEVDDFSEDDRQDSSERLVKGNELQNDFLSYHKKIPDPDAFKALQEIRGNILKEFIGKDLPSWLDPEVNGSQPQLGSILESRQVKKLVISTTWRSGSTFLGELINSYPGAFYHFEPFHYIIEQDSVPKKYEGQAIGLLATLLNCRYDTRTQPYLHHITSQRFHFLLSKNERMGRLCRHGRAYCLQTNILASACALHPLNFAKTVRLRLSALKPLLKDPSLDLKVIHLVRDPRGVFNSRLRMPWCKGYTCKDIMAMCFAANQDGRTAREYSLSFPDKFLVIRYEDLVLNPYKNTRKIFEFLNLPLVTELAVYIEEHTNTEAQRTQDGNSYAYAALYSTFRNSSLAATSWRRSLPYFKTKEVQEYCRPAMHYYGYRNFWSMKDFNDSSISVIEAPVGRTLSKRIAN